MAYEIPDEANGTVWPPIDEDDVANLASMITVLLGPLSEDVPHERLEGLARELAAHNGDARYDTFEMIEAWVGDYLD